ncbi:MAG: GNAT family N-acetyltransferase [Alphaproteobacteria bacterium]|nr:MAG: GNAT family N-acetyltransferase [Alphaproteobacteria bacterium]
MESAQALIRAMEATWAPAQRLRLGPWILRRGAGGGKRVSATTAEAAAGPRDIASAEDGMRALGQPPLFMLTPGQGALDAALAARGYRIVDPVLIFTGAADELAGLDPGGLTTLRCAAPLARMREIWAAGGIGPGRLAVMARSGEARCYLLARHRDRPRGCAFVARGGSIAMLHALEVMAEVRRQGLGRALTAAAARWAAEQGCDRLGLAVTEANAAAIALYQGLGMRVGARYHYRLLEEGTR